MKKITTLLLLSFFTHSLLAQTIQFEQIHENQINFSVLVKVSNSSTAFADIDGDNDLDVIISGKNRPRKHVSILYCNDGNGNYSEKKDSNFAGLAFGCAAFADIDNDNDPDLLISGYNKNYMPQTKMYTNDGKGNFSEIPDTPIINVANSSCVFGDVDDDNDLDMLITGSDHLDKSVTKLYINNGTGQYSEASNTQFNAVKEGTCHFADIDGDNDLDLFVTGLIELPNLLLESSTTLYKNDGKGNYKEVNMPLFTNIAIDDIAFADVDADNDLDAIITGYNKNYMPSSPFTGLYLNNGNGAFTIKDNPFAGVTYSSLAFADVDNDQDMDVIIGGDESFRNYSINIYSNDGKGNFSTMQQPELLPKGWGSIAFADMDNDRDQDLLITGLGQTDLYHNNGKGQYNRVNKPYLPGSEGGSVAFADIDGDNDQDALITGGTVHHTYSRLYKNDGKGFFTQEETAIEGVKSSSIAFTDVDGDMDQDVIVSGWNSNTRGFTQLYLNDGKGQFTAVHNTPFEQVAYSALAFADVDNDDDQDVILTGYAHKNDKVEARLYINDGRGGYTEKHQPSLTGIHLGYVAFADVDNDNDQDLMITGQINNITIISKLYTNDGTGNFTEAAHTPFEGVYNSCISFADVDNDRDQDVLISGETHGYETITKLYENKGNLNFEEVINTPFDQVERGTIAFADFDNDYYPDVVVTGRNQNDDYVAKLYQNNGKMNFTEIENAPLDGGAYGDMAISDIDGDKDLDMFITGRNKHGDAIANLYRNTTPLNTTKIDYETEVSCIKIYPNPSKGIIHVSLLKPSPKTLVHVFDLSGKLINQQYFVHNEQMQLHLKGPKGLYFIEIITDQTKQVYKVIKN